VLGRVAPLVLVRLLAVCLAHDLNLPGIALAR
jgi:hypothetical protein